MSDRRLFALSDPHLSLSGKKPMDVFGSGWDGHQARIAANWLRLVHEDDIVLVPGDISWGMRLEDAKPDLEWLSALPGRKVLLRGNHDYWWQSLKKVQSLALPNTYFLQNNHVIIDDVAIGGSRLWDFPDIRWSFQRRSDAPDPALDPRYHGPARKREDDPEKIRAREIGRLTTSLAGLPAAAFKVVITHYPPLGEDGAPTALTDLIGNFNVDLCVFGHVHGCPDHARPGADIVIGHTRYVLASSDYLNHSPLLLRRFHSMPASNSEGTP